MEIFNHTLYSVTLSLPTLSSYLHKPCQIINFLSDLLNMFPLHPLISGGGLCGTRLRFLTSLSPVNSCLTNILPEYLSQLLLN